MSERLIKQVLSSRFRNWAAQLMQLRHNDSHTLLLVQIERYPLTLTWSLSKMTLMLMFRRVSSWWRRGGGRVCPRTSPSTSSSTTPCCWSWLARMSCWITQCEASQFSFFSLEHFRSNHWFTVPELYISSSLCATLNVYRVQSNVPFRVFQLTVSQDGGRPQTAHGWVWPQIQVTIRPFLCFLVLFPCFPARRMLTLQQRSDSW